MNLPFYSFHSFFKPGNPILLFEYLPRYGRAAHYRVLLHDVVLFRDPSDIREVLIDKAASFGKDRTQKRMKILLGEGLITSDGEAHKRGTADCRACISSPAHSALREPDCGSVGDACAQSGSRDRRWTRRRR